MRTQTLVGARAGKLHEKTRSSPAVGHTTTTTTTKAAATSTTIALEPAYVPDREHIRHVVHMKY